MKGILIFDHLNDVLFVKCNKKFLTHVENLAKTQGLMSDEDGENQTELNTNIIMQIFSPVITSQQVMASQFTNSYTSMQCDDGTNIVFDDSMGFVFIYIANDDIEFMKRTLGVFVKIVEHICGPDISALKTSKQRSSLVSELLDSWRVLREYEQSFLTETVEQLCVNSSLATSTLKILQDAADKLRSSDHSNLHVLVLVENKFLSLFSSKHSQDLNASDIMLMVMLCKVTSSKEDLDELVSSQQDFILLENHFSNDGVSKKMTGQYGNLTSADIDHFFDDSRESSVHDGLDTLAENGLYSQLIFLGSEYARTANAVHIYELSEGIQLITIKEVASQIISSGIFESIHHLNVINNLQLQRDIDEIKPAFENLEATIKKTIEGIKKNRSHAGNDVDMCQRRLQVKWEFVKKKYTDLIKYRDQESTLQIESNIPALLDIMEELFRLTCFNRKFLKLDTDLVLTVSRLVKQKFDDFSDFLKVKAIKNFTFESKASLTINRYLEEFPGLVHFIYIDRAMNRLTAPTLDFTNPETLALTKKKIWSMVDHTRTHLQERQFSVMWKDTTFNYAYFLWFEDETGAPLKSKVYLRNCLKDFPIPGILCGDFYKKLAVTCFPNIPVNKIHIYELFCVHLGLASSSCVLEHTRRLAGTIYELTGQPNNPAL